MKQCWVFSSLSRMMCMITIAVGAFLTAAFFPLGWILHFWVVVHVLSLSKHAFAITGKEMMSWKNISGNEFKYRTFIGSWSHFIWHNYLIKLLLKYLLNVLSNLISTSTVICGFFADLKGNSPQNENNSKTVELLWKWFQNWFFFFFFT